ncbi:DUF4355 domain-containing protein [Anaerophilus nitritogenes]|uniref:DUF4355 domain-containing protein n=1 Tax=Anaerophilus nitritogenes TaxID=2498136 RepID=UPI00101BABBC|nr:DUF4355 domain-containing protein [Anaerophilus nitritogenes]
MELKDVKEFLDENKEDEDVKKFVGGLINLDLIKSVANEDKDVRSWLDSEKDKHSSKSLDTWKSNNLEKLLDEEIKKRFPDKDPKDTELEKMKAEIEKIKAESVRKELTNKAIKIATEKKLPVSLVDFLIANDEETTLKNLGVLEETLKTTVQGAVEEKIKGNDYKPPKDEKEENNSSNFMSIIKENQAKRD